MQIRAAQSKWGSSNLKRYDPENEAESNTYGRVWQYATTALVAF